MTAFPTSTPRIGPLETIIPGEKVAKAEFAARHALVCADMLDPEMLCKLMALCDRAVFVSSPVDRLGHRAIEQPRVAGTAVTLALSRPPLFRWLERVTGCGRIVSVDGQIVQMTPQTGDELVWHDDLGSGDIRRLGVTIGLGTKAYEGGLFELRLKALTTSAVIFKHDQPGTALIFEVSERTEHRVGLLANGGPRRVFAGWFLG